MSANITRKIQVEIQGGHRVLTRATWSGTVLRAKLWPTQSAMLARVDVAFVEASLSGHHGDADGHELKVTLSSGVATVTVLGAEDTDAMVRRFNERTMRPPYLFVGMQCHALVSGYWQPAEVTVAFGNAGWVRLKSGRGAQDEHFVFIEDMRVSRSSTS